VYRIFFVQEAEDELKDFSNFVQVFGRRGGVLVPPFYNW